MYLAGKYRCKKMYPSSERENTRTIRQVTARIFAVSANVSWYTAISLYNKMGLLPLASFLRNCARRGKAKQVTQDGGDGELI